MIKSDDFKPSFARLAWLSGDDKRQRSNVFQSTTVFFVLTTLVVFKTTILTENLLLLQN